MVHSGHWAAILLFALAAAADAAASPSAKLFLSDPARGDQPALALWLEALRGAAHHVWSLTGSMAPVRSLLEDHPDSAYTRWTRYALACETRTALPADETGLSPDDQRVQYLEDVLEAGQSFPLWDSASVLLARLYHAAGKPKDATKLLQKVPREAPDTAPAQEAASLLASW